MLGSVTCPHCGKSLSLGGVGKNAQSATIVCDCKKAFEVAPGKVFGWQWPNVTKRD